MRKLLLILALALLPNLASAQTCPTRPPGDNSNACASTAFVHNTVTTPPLTQNHLFIGNGSNQAADTALGGAGSLSGGTLSVNLGAGATITGNLPVARLNSGTGASAATFWRGDGTWHSGQGCGSVSAAVTSNYNVDPAADNNKILLVTNRTQINFGAAAGFGTDFCLQIRNANPGNARVSVNLNGTVIWLWPGQTETAFITGSAFYYTGPHRYLIHAPTLYAGPGGSCNDANDGLTQNSAGQICTITTAVALLQSNFDGFGENSSIQIADGTYAQQITMAGLTPAQVDGINFNGNHATPRNVILAPPAGQSAMFCRDYCVAFLTDLEISCANASSSGVSSSQFSTVDVRNVVIGSCDANAAFFAWSTGHIDFAGGNVLDGNSGQLLSASEQGEISIGNQTLTCVGTPGETFFAVAGHLGHINAAGLLFSGCGGVTGTEYAIAYNATINTAGSGCIGFWPGSGPGTIVTGGQCQ